MTDKGRNDGTGRRSNPAGRRRTGVHDLLDLALCLPVDAGVRSVAKAAIRALHEMTPDLAVGLCVTGSDVSEQIVEYRLPSGSSDEPARDPTRLFPSCPTELVAIVEDGAGCSTLHAAGGDIDLGDEASDLARFFHGAAAVIGRFVAHSASVDRLRDSSEEIERLRVQLIQAEKLASLGQIVAGVVHELNNPLTSIVAYSDYLRKKAARGGGDVDDVERLRRIGEAAERILLFSRDLTTYARPSRDVPGPVSLPDVIDKALLFCEHELSEARVTVTRAIDRSAPPVRGVAGQLTQVFVNLFTNACHAMARTGGTLDVSTVAREDALQVHVADSGVGMDRETAQRIFEPFFTTNADLGGTGLGLSIASEIMSAHGGEIAVRSTPGEGATFTVVLPLAARPPSSEPGPSGADPDTDD